MNLSAKRLVQEFAAGNIGLRDQAVLTHRVWLRHSGINRGDPFFDFMSEIDNPCPDLLLRARYRAEVLRVDLTRVHDVPENAEKLQKPA